MSKKHKKIVNEVKENNIVKDDDIIKTTLTEIKDNSEINPDLKDFFDEVNKKKQEIEEIKEEPVIEEVKQIKESNKGSYIKSVICIIALLLGIAYFIIYVKNAFNHVDYMQEIINGSLLLAILLFLTIAIIGNKTLRNIFGSITALTVISLISFNILVSKDIIKVSTLPLMKNFINTSLVDTMKWANENNIEIEKTYEFSDNVLEGHVITQDILPNTLLRGIKKIKLTISNGPDYNKELVLSNMVGLTLKDLLNFINTNYLQNVSISYEINEEVEKDIIITQSFKGQIKRNTPISFKISLGSKASLTSIEIDDLTNKSEFDATLYLMQYGIKYNITYDFSEKIKKGFVILQDKSVKTKVDPNIDIVNLVVSKGKKIIVPDFSSKTVDDVILWATNNNLKVDFIENYDINIAKGKLININYKNGDIVSEGTKITINTSKGALIIPTFNSLAEFYNWADSNGVSYSQAFEFNDAVKKGNIIKISKATGEKINPNIEKLVVTISYGSPVTIPNFTGMSRTAISQKCSQVGLSCGFNYTGYSQTVGKDIAVSQNKGAGGKVIIGTSVVINLSKGPAQSFTIYISDSWYGNDANGTINSFSSQLAANCPDVTFKFIAKPHNTIRSGIIHPDSPIKGGTNVFTQGNTYEIWIVS